jgi:hypothetical protein
LYRNYLKSMDLSSSSNQRKLLKLKQAAQELGVSIDDLLQLNDFNILKPTITLSGEVGYTQEQIDKFLAVQQLSRNKKIDQQKNTPFQINPQINDLPIDMNQNINEPEIPKFPETSSNSDRFLSMKLVSSFLAIILLLVVVTQQDKLKSLFDHSQLTFLKGTDNTKIALISQTNNPSSSEFTSPLAQIKVGNEDITALGNKLNQKSFTLSKLTKNTDAKIQTDNIDGINNISYSEIANFPKDTDTASNLFDNRGNIKGETTGTDVLGMAIGAAGTIQGSTSSRPIADSNILLTILALGLLYIIFILRNKLIYSARLSASVVMPRNFLGNIEKKIIEVNQKTDGTVALYFQGREYKLCKPDLDSESDQFIERLMSLAVPGVKEIDYDTLNDEEISFNASLSKLVTRLGFVGIKRDLFFPRTSKSRVLFRKYITEQDLISMNLTASDFNEFLNNA